MSPKIKVFIIYGVSFTALFLLSRFIIAQFSFEPTIWLEFIPIIIAAVLSPKPHIEETESIRRYGLKSHFSKKVYYLS